MTLEVSGKERVYEVAPTATIQTKRHGDVPLVKAFSRARPGMRATFFTEEGLITKIGRGRTGLIPRLAFMRLLVVGSDAWYAGQHRILKLLCGPETRVINSYGLTETTIDSSYYDGDAADLPPRSMTPIGRPFPNTEMYILDRQERLVPPGIWGEVRHIGGPGAGIWPSIP